MVRIAFFLINQISIETDLSDQVLSEVQTHMPTAHRLKSCALTHCAERHPCWKCHQHPLLYWGDYTVKLQDLPLRMILSGAHVAWTFGDHLALPIVCLCVPQRFHFKLTQTQNCHCMSSLKT